MINQQPNFFMVGVVKGGTTSLHYYLSQHPGIYMSPVKETNYFSRRAIDTSAFSKDYAHDVNVDLKKFFATGMEHKIHIAHIEEEEDYRRLFRNVTKETAIGEASNSYILYPGTAEEIHKEFPEAKIIMMLRNPVERAYSQYVMNLRLGKTLETDFIKEVQDDDNKKLKGWGASHQYLSIGLYYDQVKRYYDVFPKEQILICWYDEYRKEPHTVVKRIYRFLKVDAGFNADTSEKLNTAGVPRFGKLNYWINQSGLVSWAKRKLPRSLREPFKKWMYSGDKADIPVMSDNEKEWLVNYYLDDIQKLSKLTGKDLSDWLA
ncbi:MAG: sulfotransferase [Bacteroidetes bacterium]|nr:sulfotransferase [Bacteroidota bacterium]